MKFLLDQDVYAITERFLRSAGHDVMTASDLGLSRASDETVLRTAREHGRILVPATITLAGWFLSTQPAQG